tara:strand:+ start:758 stop:1381 length:624 start_codon:yes stop_codon:yes gene_type:complete
MYNILPNVGFVSKKLDLTTIKKLNNYIKNKKHNVKKELAGNIHGSYYLEDKNNWFFKNELMPLVSEYIQNTLNFNVTPSILTKNCNYVLSEFWVNFQKKYEFNPVHFHAGVFSFVIWIKIPVSFKKEKNLPFLKNSKSQFNNTFSLMYTDCLGKISSLNFHLEPEDENTILLFSSQMQHVVYPFYSSNKNRISISGNIFLDPTQISQ